MDEVSAFHSPPDVPWEDAAQAALDRYGTAEERGAHFHRDKRGFVHECYHRCPSWAKVLLVSAGMNLFWEFVTFWPIHHFYSYMHWIH